MTATGQLKDEHEGIKLMLQVLGKVCDRMASGQEIDPDHPGRIVEFLQVFADKCHHGKEEELLFPELENSGISRERGPIGVMLAEHVQGRAYVRGMSEAAEALQKGNGDAPGKFIENARNYIALLTRHIDKENNILFPMGDRVLAEDTQKDLLEKFAAVEREKIGEGTHEKFHGLLDRLKAFYLDT